MTRIDRRHPRYGSLRVRAALAEALRSGLVVPEGLTAHGRGEAFDYFLGERTTPSAHRAERVAALWLLRASHPVISVNGNVAALATPEVARLARAVPGLLVEVNLFHRTPARVRAVARRLRAGGVKKVYGLHAARSVPGLPSDRAWVDPRGIALADVCLIPLEDGDRAEALRAMGKRVIAIDLNPFSRTAQVADLPIVDELTRALKGIRAAAERAGVPAPNARFPPFNSAAALRAAREEMVRHLRRPGAARASRRPPQGSGRRSRRKHSARSRRHRSRR